jgi:hypothetical protein
MKRILGVWLYLSYKMQHHYLFQISLRNWLWALVLLPLAVAAIGQLRWLHAIVASTAGAVLLAGIEWSRRQGYVLFEPAPLQGGGETLPIGVDEPVECRACGRFAVGGKERDMVGEAAALSYVQTREHIVMARLRRRRFLLIAPSPKGEVGFWYAFFKPREVKRVQSGYIYWGIQRQAGLAIRYRSTDEESMPERTIYLTFSNLQAMRRVRHHLCADMACA